MANESWWQRLLGRHNPPAPTPTMPVEAPSVPQEPRSPKPLGVTLQGNAFVDSEGHRWVWKGSTDFLLFKRFLDHEAIDAVLDQRQQAGANLVRVLGMCQNITHFNPFDYVQGTLWYWEGLEEFVAKLASRGMYVEFTVFADAQNIMPDVGAQQAHWAGVQMHLSGKSNVFVELANEYHKNGVDPSKFNKLDGLLCARGSGLSDENPASPAWDFSDFHCRRDWKWFFTFAPTSQEIRQFPGLNVPIVNDEPMGADEVDQPGRRSTDVHKHYQNGSVSSLYGLGGTFHSQAGLTSVLWGPVQLECAKAFYRGLDSGSSA